MMTETNQHISHGDTLKRNLAQANQHQKFIREQKKKELKTVLEEFDTFKKKTDQE